MSDKQRTALERVAEAEGYASALVEVLAMASQSFASRDGLCAAIAALSRANDAALERRRAQVDAEMEQER